MIVRRVPIWSWKRPVTKAPAIEVPVRTTMNRASCSSLRPKSLVAIEPANQMTICMPAR